ncbi:MAG TPA: LysR family transcriptional regulator [Nitrospirota bacterium]|nr:LysR family transcriptional regulator [Nitrospirota bacterium]
MELRHLKYFVAVAEELHFGRAAKRLHIAQPPLSQQIMNLEDELGVKLFDRTKRTIRITDAGKYFLKEAQQILLHVEQSAETARRIYRGQSGRIIVRFVGSVIHTFLPEGLRLFRELFPDVQLILQELTSAEQVKSLHAKQSDVGLLYPDAQDSLLTSQLLTQAPLMVVLPKKHPLSRSKSLHIKELAQEHFIANTRSSEPVVRDAFISMCHSAGFSPRIAQEADQVQTVLGLVEAGLGVCLLPDFIKNIRRSGVKYIPLSGSPLTVKLAIVWRSDNVSNLVKSFVSVIMDSCDICQKKNNVLKKM